MNKIKAVIFDLDNTLYVYQPCNIAGIKSSHKLFSKKNKVNFKTYEEMYNKFRKINESQLKGLASSHNRLLYFQKILEQYQTPIDTKFALQLYEAYWTGFFKQLKLDNGAIELLSFCKKQKLKVGLLTDLTADVQFAKIDALKLNRWIDGFVTSEEVGKEKPNMQGLTLLCQKLKIKKSEAIIVGDNPESDGQVAKNANVPYVFIQRNDSPKLGKIKPIATVKSLSQIKQVLSS